VDERWQRTNFELCAQDWFRTMDNLVKDIASSDTMTRLAALEKTASKLPNKNWLRDVSVSHTYLQ